MRTLLAILALALAATTPARAVTTAEIKACFPDAVRLCAADPHNRDPSVVERARVMLCMLAHRSQVRPRCLKVFKAHGV